jgi:ferritin-like metal-binding protein YciE
LWIHECLLSNDPPLEQELIHVDRSCFSPAVELANFSNFGTKQASPGGVMKVESLQDLFIEQLQDLYDAEQQLVKALPKMANAATSDDLKNAFQEHLEKTKGHVERLEQVFEQMGERAKGKKCKGMEGLVKEGSEVISEDMDDDVKDAGLIAAAQRVEHYEIAGYGTVRTYASLLEQTEAADLLEQTLEEEKEADQTLTEIAENINMEAENAEGEESETEDVDEAQPRRAKRKTTTRKRSAA